MHIEVLRYDNNGGEKMQFETERIMVRPFNMCDSEEVYEYCSDKEIGLLAGWAAHQSLDETKIQTLIRKLSDELFYFSKYLNISIDNDVFKDFI